MAVANENRTYVSRIGPTILFICTVRFQGCAVGDHATPPQEHVSAFQRRLDLPPVSQRLQEYPPLPRDLQPEHRSLMLAYERLGLPSIATCVWGHACETSGWRCDGGVVGPPGIPLQGSDSDEDLPRWVPCDAEDTDELEHTFEDLVYGKRDAQRKFDVVPVYKRPELYWSNPPRDSRHLVWTTIAHWALERARPDLFDVAMAEVELASAGRCPSDVRQPLLAAMLANAAASFAAAAKIRIAHAEWAQAREQATHAMSLLAPDGRACLDGEVAYISAHAVRRRAELELASFTVPSKSTNIPMEALVDEWLFEIMRSGFDPDLMGRQRIDAIKTQGDAIIPFLLPHMDEIAIYADPEPGWFQRPETLGDVVVTIIEDIAGQEFSANQGNKSMDIGAHLAIYAWWAGRQEKVHEEAAASKPTPLWTRMRDKLGFEQ